MAIALKRWRAWYWSAAMTEGPISHTRRQWGLQEAVEFDWKFQEPQVVSRSRINGRLSICRGLYEQKGKDSS
jgi:hypothetical protein